MSCFPDPIRNGYTRFVDDLALQYTQATDNAITDTLYRGSKKIALFMQKNWPKLTAYLISWGVIVLIMGGIHGFETVGKPLAIGLAGGVGGGVLSGAILVSVHREEEDDWSPMSGWQLFRNYILRKLDQGTRSLFISVVVYLILHTMPYLPTTVGVFIGLAMGNHLVTQILIKPSDLTIEQRLDRLEENHDRP